MKLFGEIHQEQKEKILALAANLNSVDKGEYAECVCPKCGQMRAFFYYTAGLFSRITCNRRNDCGFSGRLCDHCEKPGPIKSECLLENERKYFERHGIDFDCLVASRFIGTLGQMILAIDANGKEWRKELRPEKGKLRWMLPKGWKSEMGEWYPVVHTNEGERLHVLEGDADWLKGIQDGLPCTASLFGARGKISTEKGKAVFVGHEEIVIVPHQDSTGLQKSNELALCLKQMFPSAKVFLCHLAFSEEEKRNAKDYSDYRLNHSLEEFQRLPLVEIEAPKEVEQVPRAILERDGKTFILNEVKHKGGSVALVPSMLADFTARIVEEIKDDDANVSQVWEIERREKKYRVELEPGGVGEVALFRKAVNAKCPCAYDVTTIKTHNAFRLFVESQSKPKALKNTQYLGRIEPSIFLFGDGIATAKGIEELGAFIPTETHLRIPQGSADFENLVEDMEKIIPGQSWKFWGFAVASLFSEEIASRSDGFPILFLRGQRGKGKNTLARIMQALFSLHNERNTTFNLGTKSTVTSLNRTASKYRGTPLTIDEYIPNEKTNLTLIALYNRAGYNRAYSDNTLDTYSSDINATFLLLSTMNIGGTKSEDLLTRVVELDVNRAQDQFELVCRFEGMIDSLSNFIPHCLAKIDPKVLLERIKAEEQQNRDICKQRVELRTLRNYTLLQECANFFYESIGISQPVAWYQIAGDVLQADITIKGQDCGQLFLETLESMVISNQINTELAKIETIDEERTLYFASLKIVLPQVRAFCKRADLVTTDEKTLAAALRRLGVENKNMRKLGSQVEKTWSYKILPKGE